MTKKGIIIGLGILGFLLLSFFILNIYIKNRIEHRLENFGKSSIEYEELEIGFLGREIEMKGLSYTTSGKRLRAQKLSIQDFGIFQYVVNDKIKIDKIILSQPTVIWSRDSIEKESEEKSQAFNNIKLEQLQILDGTFNWKKSESDSSKLYLEVPEINISNIKVDSSTLSEKIPFDYTSYEIRGDSMQLNLNAEHIITAGNLNAKNGRVSVKDLRINPLYSRAEFDRLVPYEKDRISLHVEDINLDKLSFTFRNDTLHLTNPKMTILGPDLLVYRNRILPDDPRTKKLYSEIFRKLPVKLDLKHIELKSGKIVYEEATSREGGPARIEFNQVKGSIQDLTNMQLERSNYPRTKVTANSLFMNVTPVDIEWSFDISNLNNKFLISGESENLPGNALNPYLIPAVGIEANGSLNSIYFTFTGNEETAIGDVRVNYEKFKIALLEEESREEKEIISAIANLFLDNNGHTGENVQKNIQVQRDKKKTFWFYTWSAVKKGIMESVEQF